MVNNTVFVTPITNQLLPKFCGSCWANAATSAIADRFKIAQKASRPDISLSVQELLDCGNLLNGAGSCDGGDDVLAYKYMRDFGIVDTTCAPYQASDYAFRGEGTCQLPHGAKACWTCGRFNNCSWVPARNVYRVSTYGSLAPHALDDMMVEIFENGPITCSMYAHSYDFETYEGGVLTNPTVYPYITHDVSVVGWGMEGALPYWVVRNSMGTNWGEEGWFRILRGNNTLLIESECAWGLPKV